MAGIERRSELIGRQFEVRLRTAKPEEPMIRVAAREGDDGMIHLIVPVQVQGGCLKWDTLYRIDEETLRQGGDGVVEILQGQQLTDID